VLHQAYTALHLSALKQTTGNWGNHARSTELPLSGRSNLHDRCCTTRVYILSCSISLAAVLGYFCSSAIALKRDRPRVRELRQEAAKAGAIATLIRRARFGKNFNPNYVSACAKRDVGFAGSSSTLTQGVPFRGMPASMALN
jgi:hypothetical protein